VERSYRRLLHLEHIDEMITYQLDLGADAFLRYDVSEVGTHFEQCSLEEFVPYSGMIKLL